MCSTYKLLAVSLLAEVAGGGQAFGNAKTAHNNNSSRFGKFIQVNYQETGTVRGAYVEKYLLEKSRLVYQEHNERNYHVFYYLLAGASEEERSAFHLKQPEEYHYLNQDCFSVEGEDLKHDFERLQLAMEMVGFLPKTRRQIFSLLSAILHLGNIRYKKKTYRDDSIDICNPEILPIVSDLLEVKEEMLFEALVTRKTVTVGEKLILPYKLAESSRKIVSLDKPVDLSSPVAFGISWEGCWDGLGEPLKIPLGNTDWQVGDGPLSKEGDHEGTGKLVQERSSWK
ncbi:PREDICTED: unconventional myosin-IXa-like, partial [Cariama cristata]|uniref:unconventional myosin-IXa-like n=1 Tax=Cariama cristata TaxID=54380 RepID=UPI0005204542